jgi:tetratricopeptide (TPR) repeat protein
VKINLIQELNLVSTPDEFRHFISQLRVICSNEKSEYLEKLIDKTIEKNIHLGNRKILVNLLDLKIRQIYFFQNRLDEALDILNEMYNLSKRLNYDIGLALVEQLSWHIAKLGGDKVRSSKNINTAIRIIENSMEIDDYTRNFCRYSFALENWLESRDHNSASMIIIKQNLNGIL